MLLKSLGPNGAGVGKGIYSLQLEQQLPLGQSGDNTQGLT